MGKTELSIPVTLDLIRPEIVEVGEVILHILDPPDRDPPTTPRGLRLSQRPIPGSARDPIFRYFHRHVENAFADPDVWAARFAPPTATPNPVPDLCRGLIAKPSTLVAGSEALAIRLYEIMQPVSKISPGDLAVCICRGKGGDGDWSHFVALLKIESSEGYQQVRKVEGGKEYWTLDPGTEVDVLPTTRQQLQKAAFIRGRHGQSSAYDMLLLDRQIHGGGRKVARFFMESFLAAEPLPRGAEAYTDIFYEKVLEVRNRARPDLDRDQLAEHQKKLERLMEGGELDLDDLKRLLPAAHQRSLVAALEASLPAKKVPLSPQLGKKKMGRRKFRGEGGLRLQVNASAWPDIVQQERYVQSGVGPDYWEIVLHTRTWEEVP